MNEIQQADDSRALATVPDEAEPPLMRASVIEVDLLMHAALVGEVLPIVPVTTELVALPVSPQPQIPAEPTWSVVLLNIHLRAAYRQNPLMLATPEIAA